MFGVACELSRIYDVFHVSLFKKYHPNPTHILQLEDIELGKSLAYEERPIRLLDRKMKDLKNKQIPLVKVLWSHHGIEKATWELEVDMQKKYPELFTNKKINFEVEILLRERVCEDLKIRIYFLIIFYFE